ncbi:MAG: NAD(P)H-dependent oxidoreductase [Saprospiraceae bacterium]|nr:NAD(P)H-dependent oxidoreductase [Saprospiraceae bacterium]
MITVISGTNRRNSETERIAGYIVERLRNRFEVEAKLLTLTDLPADILHDDMYSKDGQSDELGNLQDAEMVPADKFWFVFPEYNGSFPGVLKLFLDALSVRRYKETFASKKAALTGVSSGRAGNLRGMEQLTGILNHLQVVVLPNKLPISSVEELLKGNSTLSDQNTVEVLDKQMAEFLAF